MAKLIILGTSSAIPDETHENTHMVLSGDERTILIDCVSSPLLRLKRAGITWEGLTDLILTHFHPDHTAGVPSLLMEMWLLGRRTPLNIYGLHHTLDRIESMMGSYDWDSWPEFFPVVFHRLPASEMTPVMDCNELRVFASPVHHLIPTIGLRFELPERSIKFAYSCDTEPCQEVINLGKEVDILIHESAGEHKGHTSARQAGEIASKAKAKSLYLIHYPTGNYDTKTLVSDAKKTFSGPVYLAEDFMVINL